jgi:hypothetical protein
MSIAPNLRSVHDDVLKQAVIGSGAQGITPYSAIGELSRRINEANRMKQMQGQMAQQQNQPQPPIAQQVVAEADMDRGIGGLPVGGGEYAAGGVVAFNDGERVKGNNLGGANPIPYYLPEPSEERDRLNRIPGDFFESIRSMFADDPNLQSNLIAKRKEEDAMRLGRGRSRLVEPPVYDEAVPEAPVAAPKAPPAASRALAPAARPRLAGGIVPPAPVVPPPPVAQPAGPVAPPQADLEAQLQADVAKQQDLMGKQRGVAPEVQAARKRAEDMAQASVTRREADRAKMEDEMKARSGRSFTENTELIGSMLGGLRGAKTLGDALAGAGAAAGVTTTAQRKEQMEQQALMRIEANAIDTLKQAQADKQVAIATGDTDKAQAADKAIAEASTALTMARQKMRSEIAKTKAEQESAAASTTSAQASAQNAATNILSQRALEQHYKDDFKAKMAQAAATAGQRDAMMDLSREKFAEQQYKNSAEYKNIQTEIDAAEKRYRIAPDAGSKLRLENAKAKEVALRAKFTGGTPVAPPGGGSKVMDFAEIGVKK